MAGIQAEWNEAVQAAGLMDPGLPIIGNVSAQPLATARDLMQDIESQLQSRVRWTETIQLLTGRGITSFVEVGAGNVLLGLIRRIAGSVSEFQLGNPADFAALE
jgi:[acyl-carrier-protein] S-malonyltransferase